MEREMGSVCSLRLRGRRAVRPRLVFFYSHRDARGVRGPSAHATQRRKNHGDFRVVRVNVDERPDLAERFGVEVIPTLIVIEDRRVVHRIVSPRGTAQLKHELAAWLR